MNQESKEYWKTLILKSVGSYKNFFREREVDSVVLLEDGNYRVKTIKENSEDYYVELGKDLIQDYIKCMKTSYSKIELNPNLEFEMIITDLELFKQKLKEVKEYENKGIS